MHSSALNRRKLWTMSCETLLQNFIASLTPEMIARLCRRHHIPLPDANRGKAVLFQTAHEHCHRDSPLARQIQRCLNRQHAVSIARLSSRQPEELCSTIESLLMGSQTALPNVLPGILWAVCSDPRETVRPIEQLLLDELHWLGHCLLMVQFQGDLQLACADAKRSDAERETLQKELEQLKAERHTLQHDIQQLKGIKTQLMQDHAYLQRQLDMLARHCEAVEQQRRTMQATHAQPSATSRDFKKLHYALDKLTEALREQEDETQRLMAIVSSYASVTANSPNQTTCRPQTAEPDSAWPSLDLNGKKVALIGGLTKASMHYEQAIRQLGGTCVRHDGKAHQGHKKLAKIVRQADVVLCPVDCVSHGTANAAKKLCRAFDKPCYRLSEKDS